MLRARQPPTRLVWLRLGTDWPDSSVLTWPRPYICLSFYTHRAVYWGVSLTLLGWCCFSEEFLLHSSNWFIEEFLLHSKSWFYWGVSLTLLELVLLRSFSYTPRADFTEEFLLHSSSWFYWGVSLTFLMLVLVRSFSYTPLASFHWGVSLTYLILVLVKCFSYTPHATFSQVFLLHTSC